MFYCPYTNAEGIIDGDELGGFFDPTTDDFAKYITANPNYTTDYATMAAWPEVDAPMDERMEEIGWTGSNHGLMLYKTFTVDDVEIFKSATDFYTYGVYDNTIHVYVNGVEVWAVDGGLTEPDWATTSYEMCDLAALQSALVEGENHLFITLKDSFGGRNFDMGFAVTWE